MLQAVSIAPINRMGNNRKYFIAFFFGVKTATKLQILLQNCPNAEKYLILCLQITFLMEKIKQLQQDFADFLAHTNLNGQPKELYEPISYTLLQSGKRLRPMLCLLANEMFDGDEQQALWPALALETFHNFTLIHDDIMDKAPLRRGKETVYQKWNADIAILSGDAMLAMAFQFALKPKKGAELAQQLGRVAIEICEGQQMDLNFETLGNVTIDEYLEMIRLKTAVLLATALQMGATVAGANEADIQHLYNFGIDMGMSFQLQDDILDLYSDVAVFGKRHGGDIADNKKTYLYLKALELASDKDRGTGEACQFLGSRCQRGLMGIYLLLQGLQFAVGKHQHTICTPQFLLGDLQFHILMQPEGGLPRLDDIGIGTAEGVDEQSGFVESSFFTECGGLLGELCCLLLRGLATGDEQQGGSQTENQ